MATKPKSNKEPVREVDERARGYFAYLGYGDTPPDHIAEMYYRFKKPKDMLSPGPLQPSEYAIVIVLAEIALASSRKTRGPNKAKPGPEEPKEPDTAPEDEQEPEPEAPTTKESPFK